ncbi:MAG: hypothetical protein DBY32_02635 [Phascolarctobacterium sp.]|nr:MAG: hypothetical protein DBY32_02635 [Phascolarctobacterium sp.]
MLDNYELVQKGFRILHPLMANYIEQEFRRVYGNNCWQEILDALSDQHDLPKTGNYSELINSLDIMNCLRLFDRRWAEVFRAKLSLEFRNWAKELIGVRNRAAHIGNIDFQQGYAERALDTMALFCDAFDMEGVEKIRALYRKLRYGSEEGSISSVNIVSAAVSKNKQNEGVMTHTFGYNLPSWRDIMQPHPDVAEGRYRAAEFAADLAQVARGEGAIEYKDPVEFFGRTYVTEGMAMLLVQSLQRLSGQGGEPVVQLKTAFGGGKTHSMLALYHLVRGGISVDNIPNLKPIMEKAGLNTLPKANVAVLVGTALDPSRKKNPPNLPKYTVNTIWGEMAYQLVTAAGKPDLYAIISDADKRGVSPGSEALKTLFNACGPCLILMDELVSYAKKIYGISGLPAGSYDNFITFIQEITEAARASENSIVVASIPESAIEIGWDAGQRALEAIEHTFGRMESIWKPVAANEGFEVVRRRLFLDCKDSQARDMVCNAFSQFYQENSSDFPMEAKEVEYRNRMVSCYPIHPEIFDRLYGDWATLERFQRTRGVLRLMAAVIHELWMANDSSAMIMPGSIPLNTPNVRDELVRHLPETWNSIIDREVDGKDSIPYLKDKAISRYGQKLASRRVARTIMLGSAPSTSALRDQNVRGLETSRIRLGAIQPGENIADFNDALNTLHGSLTYLYNNQTGTRFWYDTKPTLRKTSEDRASQIPNADVAMEIEKRLRKLHKEHPLAGLHICPVSSNDIPDEQGARLVILRTENTFQRVNGKSGGNALEIVKSYLSNRGTSPRVYRNMIAFVAPDNDKLQDLQSEVKRFLAWQSIISDKEDLNLDGNQIREAENSLKRSNTTVEQRLKETYCWLLVPYIDPYEDIKTMQWEISDLGGGDDGIISKAVKKMKQSEQIIDKWAPTLLKMNLDNILWENSDYIEIKKLWEYLCTYCYLPRLADYNVLEDTIRQGLQSTDYFGIADGYSDGRYIGLKFNDSVMTINKSDLLVKPAIATKQIIEQQKASIIGDSNLFTNNNDGKSTENGNAPDGLSGQSQIFGVSTGTVSVHKNKRFFMSAKLDNTRVNKNVNDYLTEIIQYLMAVDGANVELTLEVSVNAPNGIPSSTVRTVSENCRTLKIQNFGFEDE